jgi:hypothetical protein
VQDTNGMLERKEKTTEKKEKEILSEKQVCLERLRAKGRWMNVRLSERDKDTSKQERRERIKESRYNRKYEGCLTEEIPEFLGRGAKERKMMARFRCRNAERKQVLDERREKKSAECAMRRDNRRTHVEWI